MSGVAGSTSPPTQETTTRASCVAPAAVVSVQLPRASSKRASTISVFRRSCERSCHFSTSPSR